MKTNMKILVAGLLMLMGSTLAIGQKIDEQRMERDIEVAENILSTLLRQQFDKQHMFFPLEVSGNYQAGYGVTFRLPADFTTPIIFNMDGFEGNTFIWESPEMPEMDEMPEDMEAPEAPEGSGAISYIRVEKDGKVIHENYQGTPKAKSKDKEVRIIKGQNKAIALKDKAEKDKEKSKEKKIASLDSMRDVNNAKIIEAAKSFLADYGDLIGQLAPNEKIIITNQGEQPRQWVGRLVNAPQRTNFVIDVLKGDLSQYKQGKLNHDQLLSKINVLNTETINTVEPDLELLSSIFGRLYQPDLAKTFFTEDGLYYERLKDYGVVFYMDVYSGIMNDYDLFSMPTQRLNNLDQKERNKKVVEMYPEFEKEIKENILEYGRTVKSIKDNELLIFNIKLTKCQGCGIPSNLEISAKGSILKEYGSGKLDKNAALSKMNIKKGPNQ